jgi:hypothetical protein
VIAKRAILTIVVIFALALISRPCWAGDNTLSDEDLWNLLFGSSPSPPPSPAPPTYTQDNPYQPTADNYDPSKVIHDPKELALLKAGDPGEAKDVSGNFAAAAMGTVALAGAPALIAGLGGPATVLGAPPLTAAKALVFFNTSAAAGSFTFDFSAGATVASQTASTLVILQGAINMINQIIQSGEVPPNLLYNGAPMTMDTVLFFGRIFQNTMDMLSGSGPVGMTDQQNTTVATTDAVTDLNNSVAYSTVDGGGEADGGDTD